MLKIKRFFPVTIKTVDEEGEPATITARIKRMTVDERAEWLPRWRRCGSPPSNALVARRADHQTEIAQVNGAFTMTEDEVRTVRLAEMGTDDREKFFAMEAEEEVYSKDFITDTVKRYVEVESGQLVAEREDGVEEEVTGGDALIKALAHREDLVLAIMVRVHNENFLNPDQKKALRRRSGSGNSSPEPRAAPRGATPEPTAPPASGAASASGGVVTGSTAASSGGAVH